MAVYKAHIIDGGMKRRAEKAEMLKQMSKFQIKLILVDVIILMLISRIAVVILKNVANFSMSVWNLPVDVDVRIKVFAQFRSNQKG